MKAPAPLRTKDLAEVPGVLGTIARERANDYAGERTPDAVAPSGADPARLPNALRAPGLSVMAEIKRGSPSAGTIAPLDPVRAARAYQRGGAAALSVLTEPRHFGGSLTHLRRVAEVSDLPVMRKEFVVHPLQVAEAADAGADGVLLIAAVLGPALAAYLAYARAFGLAALVEVHDEAELDAALAAGTDLLGVNNRDLGTLEVDLSVAPRLLTHARGAGFEGVSVAESGYARAEELRPLRGVADAVLIGTSLAGSEDLEVALRTLREGLDAGEEGAE